MVLCAVCAAPLHAATFYVSCAGGHQRPFDKWDNAATNIQSAIDAAQAGATVLIKPGHYTGQGENVASIPKPLELKGESGNPSDVIIDGEGARRGMLVVLTNENCSVVISGLTITNCHIRKGYGAGICIKHDTIAAGTTEVRQCVITGNLNESPYTDNSGGGLASRGKTGSAFHTIIADCAFSGNAACNRGSRGGGAAFQKTRLTMENCLVKNNRSEGCTDKNQDGYGGGVDAENTITGSVIRATAFHGNFAKAGGGGGGGGLRVGGADTDLLLADCVFETNESKYGAALMQTDGRLILRNCRIENNSGAMSFWTGWAKSFPTSQVVNCKISGGIILGENAGFKAIDSMKDPAAFIDASGEIRPVRTIDDWNRRRAAIIARIERVASPLPDKTLFPVPALKVLKDEVIEGRLRRQLIEYNAETKAAPRIKAWLFSPTTNSCLEAAPSAKDRRPAVLCPHQTNRTTGKNEPAGLEGDTNMFYALELARRGFVTLAPDFTGSGEHPGWGTYTNDFVSGTMKGISDHIRAVELLCSMPGVDPARIGCIGHSLGGFNTMMVSVFEPRIKAIVSSCGYVNWQTYADREGSLYMMGGGNYMPLINRDYASRADLVPFDWHEVVAACAPRPLFLNAPLRDDPFLVEGVCETIEAARPIYKLYGAADVIQTTHPDCGHGFPPEVREKAYQFMEKHLAKK